MREIAQVEDALLPSSQLNSRLCHDVQLALRLARHTRKLFVCPGQEHTGTFSAAGAAWPLFWRGSSA